jgi:iron(III) transport system substrate-binding protein
MKTPARVKLTLAHVAVAVMVATGLAACSSSGGSATTITLYSGQHPQTTQALVTAFEKQTGIKVKVRSDDEDVLTAAIEQEGSRTPADVFFTENSNWLAQLDEHHMLAHVDAAGLAPIPSADSASDGNWVGISARVSLMIYDPSKLSPSQLPTSILGLADPKWKGKIEIAPSETDFWPLVDSVARADGTAAALTWLKGLKANAGSNDNVPDNETITSDVSQGRTELGVINHYYYYRLKAEVGASNVHSALAYFAPGDPGYVLDVSTAGILASSKHQAAAQQFVAFMTSQAGQSIIAHSESFEYPLNASVAANPELPPLSGLHPNSFTVNELGDGLEAKTLLQEAQLL